MKGTFIMVPDPSDGVCEGYVEWESAWKHDNFHSLKLKVCGGRTDTWTSTSMFGYIYVNGESTNMGVQNYPADESFEIRTIEIETDDYGVITSSVLISIGFYSQTAGETFWANADFTGLQIDKPIKNVSIETPDGITCTIDKATITVGDKVVVSVVITGLQWENYTLSVTGATKIDEYTYTVESDLYIVVTGVLTKHTIYVNGKIGITVTIVDDVTGDYYTDGSKAEHYSSITISCSADLGYQFDSITINGEIFQSPVSIEVTSDVIISVNSKPLGAVHIYTGNGFELFQVYIYDGSSWHMMLPYMYDGSVWSICV